MEKISVTQFSFEELIDLKDIQRLMDVLNKLTGIPVIVTDNKGYIKILAGKQKFCKDFHSMSIDNIHCKTMAEISKKEILSGSLEFVCEHLVSSIAIPVILEEERIATVFLGQFLFEEEAVNREKYVQHAKVLNVDVDEYMQTLDQVPRFSHEFIDNAIEFHLILAHLISTRCQTALNLKREQIHENQLSKSIQQKERFYEDIFDKASDGIFISDKTGKLLHVNKRAGLMTGYSREEMLSMNFFDIEQQHTIEDYHHDFEHKIRENKFFVLKSVLKRKSGECFPVSLNFTQIFLDNEEVILALARDLTEEEKLDKQIRDHEKLLNIIMETTPTAIMMYQNDKWVYTNRAGCEISGFSEEELLQMRYYDFIHPDYRQMIYDRGQARQSGEFSGEMNYDFVIISRSGKEKWVHLDGAVATFNGKPAGLISVLDITNLKETEFRLQQKNEEIARQNEEYVATNEELNQTLELLQSTNHQLEIARDKAQESDRLKSAFLANMSHEIRTPMNAILGFSRLLESESLPIKQQKSYVDHILNSGDQLLRIINDIIDISKIEANILKVDLAPVNINDIILHIADKKNNPYHHPFRKEVDVIVRIPDGKKDFYIESDKIRLTQIINNLVNNAAKYTYTGTIETGYNVLTRNNRDYVEIYVKDTGKGIKKEHQKTIFNRFTQVGDENYREGNGLGLSIVKGLTELLGGEIRLKSIPEEGSVFSIFLPNFTISKPIGDNPNVVASTKAIFDDKLMYLAEDDSSSAFLIQEILRNTGISIRVAENGADLLSLIDEKIPDVVILDINMPVMNGYEAIREIRKKYDDLPVVAQTAYAMPDEKERILQAGCNEYISKPLNSDLFLLTLKKVIN